MQKPKIILAPEERAQRLLDGREGWRSYVCETGGGSTVCAVERDPKDDEAPYAWITGAERAAEPYLLDVYLPSRWEEPITSKAVCEADLEPFAFAALTGADQPPAEEPMPASITVVDVAARTDPIYVFGHRGDAERFAAAINGGDALDNPAYVSESPVNVGHDAEMLIGSERADALEDHGLEDFAERLRADPAGLNEIAIELRRRGEPDQEEILASVERWLGEDGANAGLERHLT